MTTSTTDIVFEQDLNAESVAQVGETIRAYDSAPMEGRGECYIEGVVTEKGPVVHPQHGVVIFHGFTLQMTKRVWDGAEEVVPADEIGYVPFAVSMLDWDGRVTNINEAA